MTSQIVSSTAVWEDICVLSRVYASACLSWGGLLKYSQRCLALPDCKWAGLQRESWSLVVQTCLFKCVNLDGLVFQCCFLCLECTLWTPALTQLTQPRKSRKSLGRLTAQGQQGQPKHRRHHHRHCRLMETVRKQREREIERKKEMLATWYIQNDFDGVAKFCNYEQCRFNVYVSQRNLRL